MAHYPGTPSPKTTICSHTDKIEKEENHALCLIDLIFQIFYFLASALTVIRMG